MRSGYGEKLREYFSKKDPLYLLDFGGFKVFESATVDTNILLVKNCENENMLQACHFGNDYRRGGALREYCAGRFVELRNLSSNTWFIGSPTGVALKEKIERIGKPLKEWDVKIARGIITGLNEAFIIDQNKRDELVVKDPKSVEILKPILRGRNITRYGYEWMGSYVIAAGFDSYKLLKERYPFVYEHLKQYEKQLRARGQCKYSRAGKNGLNADYDGQHHWLELDNNPKSEYLGMFEMEKVVWIELVDDGRFAYVEPGVYTEATTFLMTFDRPKYLVGLMNSKLVNWYFDKICGESGVGTNRWKKFYVEVIPLPNTDDIRKIEKIENLVNEILVFKKVNPSADVRDLEDEIDRIVYQFYDLTEEEIRIIEGN